MSHAVLIRPGVAAPLAFATAGTTLEIDVAALSILGASGKLVADGCAIELGYFSEGTIHDLFAGSWTPLIGSRAAPQNRQVALIRTHSKADPTLSWSRTFYAEVDALPDAERPLALRFFDHADPAQAVFFNTASHPSWWFRAPREPNPAFVFMSLDAGDVSWESGPGAAFRTTLLAQRPEAVSMGRVLRALGLARK